jgi:hypothetical protein
MGQKFTIIHRDGKGKLHHIDGPAIEWASGRREWWLNGNRHRDDGPAVEWSDGSREWWLNGKCHHIDGPAAKWVSNARMTKWFLRMMRAIIGSKGCNDGPL